MENINTKQLGVVDWVFFSSLLVVSLGIGIYSALRGRGNNSTQEFLLGGRQMSPVPVAISLLGGVISAISILGLATEMYFFGTQLTLNMVGCFWGVFVVYLLILPILYPLKVVSVNEYISLRYGSQTFRKVATACSLVNTFIYMGMCLYAPSLTLSTVTNLSTWQSIAIMGSICTFYISIGGVKAVVYTDVVQTLLMFSGVLVVVIICCTNLGGIGNVFRIAEEGGRLEFFNMDPNPLVRHTFWSVQSHGFYLMVSYIGLSQITYQRFASVKSLAISRRLCIFFLFGLVALWLVFYFSGIVAYATYSHCDPFTLGLIEKPDQILPYLVLDKLSHIYGMAGIFVAAVYGGVLSTLSSTGNSVACLLWEDFFKHLRFFKGFSDAKSTVVIKLLSALAGIIGILLGLLAGELGSIIQVSSSISNAVSGSLTGIFITGMCAPWVNRKGAYAGYFTGLVINVWLVVGQFMQGLGDPQKLPLSIDNCPEDLLLSNSTLSSLVNGTALSLVSTTPFPEFIPQEEEDSRGIYHISYGYTGVLGVIINYVVSSVVSALTGPIHPEDVDSRLISPTCLKLYKRVWRLLRLPEAKQITADDKLLDGKAVIAMIDRQNSHHLEKSN